MMEVECLTHLCAANWVASRVEDLCGIGSEVPDVWICSQSEQVRSVSLVCVWTCVRVETRHRNGCAPAAFSTIRSNFDLGKGDAGRINKTGHQHVDPTHARGLRVAS